MSATSWIPDPSDPSDWVKSGVQTNQFQLFSTTSGCWSIWNQDQNWIKWSRSFLRANKGDFQTAEINKSRTYNCNLTFETLKIKWSRLSEGNNQAINHIFTDQNSRSWSQMPQPALYHKCDWSLQEGLMRVPATCTSKFGAGQRNGWSPYQNSNEVRKRCFDAQECLHSWKLLSCSSVNFWLEFQQRSASIYHDKFTSKFSWNCWTASVLQFGSHTVDA